MRRYLQLRTTAMRFFFFNFYEMGWMSKVACMLESSSILISPSIS